MKTIVKVTTILSTLSVTALLLGCGKVADSGASIDTSTSGVAAGVVGGALSASSSSGTQARMNFQKPSLLGAMIPSAVASNTCPTFKSTDSNCSVSGSAMWLNYAGCSFAGYATWTGVQEITMSSGSAACGSFPNPGANGTLYRQFVSAVSSNTPGSLSLVGALDTASVDNSSANLSNFDGVTISAIHNGGYGSAVSFDGAGKRNALSIGEHITLTGIFDHSVSGNLTLVEATGQRTATGTMKVYHNLMKVIATSTFNSVVHTDMCCWPVGGSISTVFSAGQNVSPTALGTKLVGKSETLSFTGACGSGTLTATDGSTSAVSFNRCF